MSERFTCSRTIKRITYTYTMRRIKADNRHEAASNYYSETGHWPTTVNGERIVGICDTCLDVILPGDGYLGTGKPGKPLTHYHSSCYACRDSDMTLDQLRSEHRSSQDDDAEDIAAADIAMAEEGSIPWEQIKTELGL